MLNGPTHEIYEKLLVDTMRDYLNGEKHKLLIGTCGVTQRRYDFLLGYTFLSLGILENFCNLDQETINRISI